MGISLIVILFAFILAIFASCGNSSVTPVPRAAVSDDFKTTYYVGESLVVGGNLKMYVGNDSRGEVPITAEMISGFDTSVAGTVFLKVTYGDFSVTVPITVIQVQARSLTIDVDTIPAVIYDKEPFPSTITMTVALADGSEQKGVVVTENMLGGFDRKYLGNQNISVTYLGATTYFMISVKEDVRVSIDLVGAKSEYKVNEPLSIAGAVLKVHFASGRIVDATLMANDVSDFTTALGGEYKAKVSYKGLVCDYPYFVRKEAAEFTLDAETLPVLYEKGDVLPETGTGVLTYDDGTRKRVTALTSENIPDFSTAVAGEITVNVVVAGVTDTYTYTVLPSIIMALPFGYTSAVKQNSLFDGLGEFIVIYENAADGSEQRESIPLSTGAATRDTVEDETGAVIQRITTDRLRVEYVTTVAGDIVQKVYFRTRVVGFTVHVYSEAESATAVENIDVAGVFAPIRLGDPIVVSGVQIGINYKYLSYDVVECLPSWVSVEMPESIEGDYVDLPVTISCFGVQTESSVRVLSPEYAAKVTSLTVLGAKTLYFVGDEFSAEGSRLYVVYGGGYDSAVVDLHSDHVSGFDTTAAGEKEMTVTYEGGVAVVAYRVISEEDKARVTAVSMSNFTPLLFVGDTIESIDLSAYEVTVIYGYGYASETVPLDSEGITLSGGPFDEAGLREVLLTCGEVQNTYFVTVYDAADKQRVTSIAINPDAVTSEVGQLPDLSQVPIVVTFGYGYRRETILIGSEGVSVDTSALDVNRSGLARATVTYEGCTCDAFVNFVSGESGNVLRRLEIESDSKTIFTVGDEFGGVYLIRYYRSESDRLAVTADMIPDFTTEVAGSYSTTISYGGKGVIYAYTVVEAPSEQSDEEGQEEE